MTKLKKSAPDFDYDSDLDLEVESKFNAKLMAKFWRNLNKNVIFTTLAVI